jgi:hypothetical protein
VKKQDLLFNVYPACPACPVGRNYRTGVEFTCDSGAYSSGVAPVDGTGEAYLTGTRPRFLPTFEYILMILPPPGGLGFVNFIWKLTKEKNPINIVNPARPVKCLPREIFVALIYLWRSLFHRGLYFFIVK